MAGPGRVHVFSQGKDYVTARLYNFDIEKHVLKPEHERWLKDNVLGLLNRGGSMWLAGLTSRSGSEDLNLPLSRARADAVTHYLRFQKVMALGPFGGKFNVTLAAALGETAARYAGVADGVEDENWRGVVLQAWIKPTPPPPPPPPPKPAEPAKIDRKQSVAFWTSFEQSPDPADGSRAQKLNKWATDHVQDKYFATQPLRFVMQPTPKTHQLIRVCTFRVTEDFNVGVATNSSKICRVVYQWGVRKRPTCYLVHGYWRDGAFKNDDPFLHTLSDADAERWLNDPIQALADYDPRGKLVRLDFRRYVVEGMRLGEPDVPLVKGMAWLRQLTGQ
jgi:hypothetical protein